MNFHNFVKVVFATLLLTFLTEKDDERKEQESQEDSVTLVFMFSTTESTPVQVPRSCMRTEEGREHDTEVLAATGLLAQVTTLAPLTTFSPPLLVHDSSLQFGANSTSTAEPTMDALHSSSILVSRMIQMVERNIEWTEGNWSNRMFDAIRSGDLNMDERKNRLLSLHFELSDKTGELLRRLQLELMVPGIIDDCNPALVLHFLDDLEDLIWLVRGSARWLSEAYFSPAQTHNCDAESLERLRKAALPPPNWLSDFRNWLRSLVEMMNYSSSEDSDTCDCGCRTPPKKIRRMSKTPERPRKLFGGHRLEYLGRQHGNFSRLRLECQTPDSPERHIQNSDQQNYFVMAMDSIRKPNCQRELEDTQAFLGTTPHRQDIPQRMEESGTEMWTVPTMDGSGSQYSEVDNATIVTVDYHSPSITDVVREEFEPETQGSVQDNLTLHENGRPAQQLMQLTCDEPAGCADIRHLPWMLLLIPSAVAAR